ncbi:uncharacterized protein LOC117117853, partial [Anneissia japonica]|uniref:uncharacterized protein LOC117117853 n=1 Tax=Anneissia japonica TaxID=1529436 RepID=UPI00142553A4
RVDNVYADVKGYSIAGGTVPPSVLITKAKPDIVIVTGNIELLELTVPFEMNIDKAHRRKEDKYKDTINDIVRHGFRGKITCLEIGSRGLITPANECRIKDILKITSRNAKAIIKEISETALVTSYTIWNARFNPAWENITLM